METVIFFVNGIKIAVKEGDILKEKVDVIVNPANCKLKMGGSLSKYIKEKAGKEVEQEAIKKGPIEKGETIYTKAGKLPFKYIFHTATMDMDFKTDISIIRKCVINTLSLAENMKIKSISFPALGCGTGKLNPEEVAKIMVEEFLKFQSDKKISIEEISFVLKKKKDFEIFKRVFMDYLTVLTKKTYKNPVPTVDIIIRYQNGIVLIKRKNYPLGWAIPGGFVEYGESMEETAIREAKEETGLEIYNLEQFHTYSKPGRDPRFHTITTVFTAEGKGVLKGGDDAKEAKVFNRENLPEDIAFDHREIINDYFKKFGRL